MLQDAKVGTLIGIESHMYKDCPALFTAKSNEKTKLLFIDKEGFDLYLKDFLMGRHRKIMNFYQSVIFLRNTQQSFHSLLRLVLMSEHKTVIANTCVLEQGDVCKYLFFVINGRFTVIRSVDFIDELIAPLEHQLKFVEGLNKQSQIQAATQKLRFQEPSEYACTSFRK